MRQPYRPWSRRIRISSSRACAVAGSLAVTMSLLGSVQFDTGNVRAAVGNRGDVWVDTFGGPPGPGHEQDPHLPCADINLWGNGLADSSGTYFIDGWPPTGSQEEDYSSTWSYDTTAGGTQVISVINVGLLTSTATANGDSPINKQ